MCVFKYSHMCYFTSECVQRPGSPRTRKGAFRAFHFSDPLGFSRDKNGKEWTANLGEKGREGKGGKDGQGTKVEAWNRAHANDDSGITKSI